MILDHVHGTSNNRCDHPDCKAAFARYCKRWRYDVSHGRKRLVDAEPVRLHIFTLHGLGWSTRAIAGTAGISPSVVSKIALGQAKVSRKIAAAVMRVDVDSLPARPSNQVDEPTVPKMGTCRRIEALLALGWTHDAQRAHCGVATHLVLAQRGRWVYRSTHDKIAAMYRELSSKPGPSERTRRRAAKRGYATPAEWDDIDHDAEPDRVYVLRRGGSAGTGEWVAAHEAPFAASDAPRLGGEGDVDLDDEEDAAS